MSETPHERSGWEREPRAPHIWLTLGYERSVPDPGRAVVEWDATPDHCISLGDRFIVHGGMVTAILDTAMAGACQSALAEAGQFLTADLHVDFYRAARPGRLRASAHVAHRSRRAMFCVAELVDSEGVLLAAGRCTQIVLPAE